MSESFLFGGGGKITLAYVEPGTLTVGVAGSTPAITITPAVTLTGALTLSAGITGSLAFTTSLVSTTALATPSALAATQFTAFASTVSGATLMGFGTSNDWALKNRAGTTVLSCGPNNTTTTAAGAIIVGGTAAFANSITSNHASGGIGYATGAGGTATQITNRSTGVTMSPNPCTSGLITTDTTSLAAEASAAFVVTNSAVAIGDVVVASIRSGSDGGNTAVTVTTVAAGSFTLRVSNNNAAGGTAETGAILINFAVFKAVSA